MAAECAQWFFPNAKYVVAFIANKALLVPFSVTLSSWVGSMNWILCACTPSSGCFTTAQDLHLFIENSFVFLSTLLWSLVSFQPLLCLVFSVLSLSSYQDPTTPVIFRPFRAVVSGLADTRGSIKKQILFCVSRGRNWQYTAPDLSAVFQLMKPLSNRLQ